jgi:hypothetical protein
LFWTTYHNGTDNETWSNPIPITDKDSVEREPSLIADSAGNLILAFSSQAQGSGSVELMTYSGGAWSAPTMVYSREGKPWGTSLIQDKDGTLWVAFGLEPNGIYVTNNSEGTWSAPNWAVKPTPTYDSSYPSLIQDFEGYLRISFRYWDHAGDREIYWTRSLEPITPVTPVLDHGTVADKPVTPVTPPQTTSPATSANISTAFEVAAYTFEGPATGPYSTVVVREDGLVYYEEGYNRHSCRRSYLSKIGFQAE